MLGVVGAVGGFIVGGPVGGVLGLGVGSSISGGSSSGTRKQNFSYEIQVPEVHEEKKTKEFENKPDLDYCYRLALDEYDKKSRNEMIIR